MQHQRNTPRLIRSGVTMIITVAVLAASLNAGANRQPLDRVVAIVNDGVVLESELNERVSTIRNQLRLEGQSVPPQNVLRRQLLDRMVTNEIQLQRAERAGIRVGEEQVNNAVANIARQNDMSLDEFARAITREGINFETFREEVREQIILEQVRQREVHARINITEREVDNFLENLAARGGEDDQFRLRHILLALPENPSQEQVREKRRLGEQLLERARAGENFRDLAIAHSDGQQALEGGDLGWRRRTELPTLFVDVADDISQGETSDLIRSPSGFHLVYMDERRGGEPVMVEEIRARHILMRPGEVMTEDEVVQRLRELARRAQAGEDLGELAPSFSEDSGSAARGGDLGWIRPGDTVSEFEQELREMRPGDIRGPFQTRFGWHVVEVTDRRRRDMTDEARRNEARRAIFQRKAEEETEMWLRRIRGEAFVEMRLER